MLVQWATGTNKLGLVSAILNQWQVYPEISRLLRTQKAQWPHIYANSTAMLAISIQNVNQCASSVLVRSSHIIVERSIQVREETTSEVNSDFHGMKPEQKRKKGPHVQAQRKS